MYRFSAILAALALTATVGHTQVLSPTIKVGETANTAGTVQIQICYTQGGAVQTVTSLSHAVNDGDTAAMTAAGIRANWNQAGPIQCKPHADPTVIVLRPNAFTAIVSCKLIVDGGTPNILPAAGLGQTYDKVLKKVPAMSNWALLATALGLGTVGLFLLRHRQARRPVVST